MIPEAEKIVITPELQAKIAATQAQQADADKIGLKAAGTTLPGPARDVWCDVPDIKEGPFTIRRLRDGDFVRLAQLGHPLNSFNAIGAWLKEPQPSGKEAWMLNWLMSRPVAEVKAIIAKGRDAVEAQAEEQFSELDGYQLAHLMYAVVKQISIYMGAKVDYEQVQTGEAGSSPPPLSQP